MPSQRDGARGVRCFGAGFKPFGETGGLHVGSRTGGGKGILGLGRLLAVAAREAQDRRGNEVEKFHVKRRWLGVSGGTEVIR